ncbi:ribonuclease H-like domain-containing protein [Delphinella strobiligena]|nr:ribonuclease H-like domain-containing protein [Delphinella strobiligena]
MEGFSGFKALQDSIQQSLVATTRSATQISSEDLGFHRSLDPSLATSLDKQNARLLALAERLLGNAASNTEIVRPRLPDVDAVDGNWRGIVDVVDSLLEKADISLDEYTGAVKRLTPSREETPSRSTPNPKTSRIAQAIRSQDLPKPQLSFQHVPTNAENEPFKPLLEAKPHARVPFKQTRELIKDEESGRQHYPHPYQDEIQAYEYPSFVYTQAEPIPYKPYESTTAVFVDTEEALADMLQELKGAKEIAIDLEHHDQRSYIGIVSLMQISTRDKDWVVDTLQPWRRKLSCLNEVFANPNIVKVLHGAFMDIVWLQRDLGIYVVGLFDTHYASRALGYTGGSLAFLLKKFVDFDAQKQYQTADWRIRPLPTEMFEYARSDTHFLLYIYDNMRNELIEKSDFSVPNHEKDKINDVLVKSMETALQRYEHPIYDNERGLGPMGWYKLLSRTPALLTNQQFAVFRAVHHWRDTVAREQDDSIHFVMANHNVFSVAKEMPTEKPALFSIAQPTSQTVRLRADELLAVIRKAKEEGVGGPDMMTTLRDIEIHVYGPEGAPFRPNNRPALTPNIAPTAPVLNRITNPAPVTQAVRSSNSFFWGNAFGNNKPQSRPMTTDLHLSVPLPALTAEIFAENGSYAESPAAPTPKPDITESPVSADKSGEVDDGSKIFTLKQLSRKRKSDAISNDPARGDNLATQADEIGIEEDDYDDLEARKLEKAAKKAARRAKKEEEAKKKEEEEAELEDFDYSKAVSILNANRNAERENRGKRKKGGDKPKHFDPYKKALDAPKGLPRAQKERAGRSHTFKQ